MRTAISLALLFVVFLSGCKTAYFPRIVNYTNEDIAVTVTFDAETYNTVIRPGKRAYLGMKNRDIESIKLSIGQEERIIDKEEMKSLGGAQVYAVKSISDIQKSK